MIQRSGVAGAELPVASCRCVNSALPRMARTALTIAPTQGYTTGCARPERLLGLGLTTKRAHIIAMALAGLGGPGPTSGQYRRHPFNLGLSHHRHCLPQSKWNGRSFATSIP